MQRFFLFVMLLGFLFTQGVFAQTVIPNGDFETWISHTGYTDPQYWDTPNAEVATIPFVGVVVVSKSTDHESGAYSAKLETMHLSLPPMDIPGFITLGNLTVNITAGTYDLTGGAPITDSPTHLQGYFKYQPKGGDSCVIAMVLYKTNSGVRDTIGGTFFSSRDTVPDWTPFSAWIDYTIVETPDTMNIFAISTAQETGMHPGTALYIDNLTLDYTLSVKGQPAIKEIDYYQDKETRRLLVFCDFPGPEMTSMNLYNMTGVPVAGFQNMMIQKDRKIISYGSLPRGVYLLEVLHDGKKFSKKFFINF